MPRKKKNSDSSEASISGNTSEIESRAWFFTWNNPECERIEIPEKWEYVYQLERGEGGTPHFQGVFRNPSQIKFHIVKEILGPKAHIEKCKTWRHAKKYCCKQETRIAGPWTNISGLRFKPTVLLPDIVLRPWQLAVERLHQEKPDDRKIFWFWDPDGKTGKSTFIRYMKIKYPKQVFCMGGKASDMKFMIIKKLEDEQMEVPYMMFIDITRSQEARISYQGIEEIKNGLFFSGKYESSDIVLPHPHVFCFANFRPDTSTLSADRWEIINLLDLVEEGGAQV